jgi:agmatinase
MDQDHFSTFAGFPFCSDLDELTAEMAVIGIPFGVPYDASQPPDSLNAPAAIRRESAQYPDDPVAWDFDLGGTLLDGTDARVVDCGNLPGSQIEPQQNQRSAVTAIRKILAAGAIPLVLGGDDSIPIPVLRAYEGCEPFYILQLDAHIDWRDHVNGISEGYSSTMRRASEMPWVKGITQVGMRAVGSAREEEIQAAHNYGANLIPASIIRRRGIDAALSYLPSGSRCFITIDLDVFDPMVMPAANSLTPGGLEYFEVIELIHAAAQNNQVVGACIVSLVPEMDMNNIGSITAMRIMWNLIGSIARKKSGQASDQ